MFNFYLSPTGYKEASSSEIEENLILLNELIFDEGKSEDIFLKNDSIWEMVTKEGLLGEIIFSNFKDMQFACSVVPKLLESLQPIQDVFYDTRDFDNSIYKIYNSFYGAVFEDKVNEKHISTKMNYIEFKAKYLWDITPESFWERREMLFTNIILCPSVESDLKKVAGSFLTLIKDKLAELDRYISINWKDGTFNYIDANQKSSLSISPESDKTMKQEKYYNQRLFSMPDGRRVCFELHIKTSGNLRFHFYPENNKIYIGYIGKHLDTDRFN
jgi:hypothetical protein